MERTAFFGALDGQRKSVIQIIGYHFEHPSQLTAALALARQYTSTVDAVQSQPQAFFLTLSDYTLSYAGSPCMVVSRQTFVR